MASWILEPIRNIYVSLHQDTNSAPTRFSASTRNWGNPPWYPVCNIAGPLRWFPASLANPDAPSPSYIVENLTDVPPFDDFRPAHQTTIKSLRIPVTSPEPAPAGTTQETVNSDPLPPDPPSSASYNIVSSNILPTEYHRASSGLTPAPDLGVAVEDVGSPKPNLRKEQNKLDPPSVNREILATAMATLDLPPHSSSPQSNADLNVAITSHSLKEPKPERPGDPPRPSDYRYDIV
ncbi:hypothetical protein EDB92DRAFT_1877586 [Lactarius akahatsu]|uniref:Uncharacterized protein n=1 Tax=Lactarius akahatsu TaxID=416441 RepID=A0AAD4LFY0_9AGAM|nr:hypothetical protein EDB92DRAFT_1877586 [Lactarius akahatsu]